MPVTIQDCLYATVAYADIFEYPLTEDEAHTWLIHRSAQKILRLPRGVSKTRLNGTTYMYLTGKKSFINQRISKHIAALGKWKRAHSMSKWLAYIPSVQLIGVTGALAMNNAHTHDDIDIVIMVKSNTLWVTRFVIIIVAEIFGIRRRPGDRNIEDKFCFNMFLSDTSLTVSNHEKDLYSAHEVLQMVPLWSTDGAYRRFLRANSWVKKYLPNAWNTISNSQIASISMHRKSRRIRNFFWMILRFLDPVFGTVQIWYMRKRRTGEVITQTVLRFHPNDARIWIKQKLALRLSRIRIPIDKIFYAG